MLNPRGGSRSARSRCPGCPSNALCPLKEQEKIRVDGLGRMIERSEAFSADGYLYELFLVETTAYFKGGFYAVHAVWRRSRRQRPIISCDLRGARVISWYPGRSGHLYKDDPMQFRTFATLCACTLTLSLSACKKSSKDDAPAPSNNAPAAVAAPAPTAAPTPPPAPPPAEYSPEQLFKATAGLGRMELADKFPTDAVDLAGAITKINDDPVGEYVLVFDAGGGNTVETPILGRDAFKGVKVGDTVHLVKCGLTTPAPTKLTLSNCTRK